MADAPWAPEAFERRYAADADPWSFATSAYELGRYDAIVSALAPPPHRYRLGFEPACSIGVLTVLLAARCDALIATDVSPTAVEAAQRRCLDQRHVAVRLGGVQDGPGDDVEPDLVVLSELGYYFAEDELGRIVDGVLERMARGGDLVACHWTGESPDHQLSGAQVHRVLADRLDSAAEHVRCEVHDGFLLDAWRLR